MSKMCFVIYLKSVLYTDVTNILNLEQYTVT